MSFLCICVFTNGHNVASTVNDVLKQRNTDTILVESSVFCLITRRSSGQMNNRVDYLNEHSQCNKTGRYACIHVDNYCYSLSFP